MRRRVIGNMMGQPSGGGGGFSNFNHVWDFTDASGNSVPDIVGSADITLSGGCSSDSTGTWALYISSRASVATSSLTIPAAVTFMVAIADVNSRGVSNIYGRYISGEDSNYNLGIYQRTSLTNLAYRISALDQTEFTVGDMSAAATVIAIDSNGLVRVSVGLDAVVESPGSLYNIGTTLNFMNRPAADRAADAIFVAGGVYDGVQTEAVFLQAAADLLAL